MRDHSRTFAMALGTLGMIFSMAMAFGILSWRIALFASAVCFILAGMSRRIGSQRK